MDQVSTPLPEQFHRSGNQSSSSDLIESCAAEDLWRDIETLSEPLMLEPDRVLCREGDEPRSLYLLKSGKAIFTIQSGGQIVPCFAVGAGSLIGLSSIIARTPFALTATASPGSEVRQIDALEFLALIDGKTDRYMGVLRILAEETLRAHQALAELLAS